MSIFTRTVSLQIKLDLPPHLDVESKKIMVFLHPDPQIHINRALQMESPAVILKPYESACFVTMEEFSVEKLYAHVAVLIPASSKKSNTNGAPFNRYLGYQIRELDSNKTNCRLDIVIKSFIPFSPTLSIPA